MNLGTLPVHRADLGNFGGVGQAKAPIRKSSERTASADSSSSSSAVKFEISMMKQTPGMMMFKEMSIYAASGKATTQTEGQEDTSKQMRVEMAVMKQTIGLTLLKALSVYRYDARAVREIGGPNKGNQDDLFAHLTDFVRKVLEEAGPHFEGISTEDAQAAIADDGYWGAPATSQRILDFVQGISNGNPELFETVKNAVIEGFDQARASFGGWLPDVSERTFDLMIKGLDEMFAVDEAPESPEPVESATPVTV